MMPCHVNSKPFCILVVSNVDVSVKKCFTEMMPLLATRVQNGFDIKLPIMHHPRAIITRS